MAGYSTLTDERLTAILDRYGIRLLGSESMPGGSANSSHLLDTDNGKLVLTIADEKSFEAVENLTALLQFLERARFPSNRVLALPDDTTVISEEGRPLYLKRFIDGDPCERATPAVLEQSGAELARLHATPVLVFLPERHAYGVEEFPSLIGRGFDESYEAWLADWHARLSGAIDPSLPKGLIHGDLFGDNLVVRDNRLVALIDFEEACHDILAFDIGMALVGLCSPDGEPDLVAADCFLDGYQQVRQLQAGEKEALQLFSVYAAVATSFWRFRHFRLERPSAESADSYREMCLLADRIAGIPHARFMEALFPGCTWSA